MPADERSPDAHVTVKLFAWLRDLFGFKELRLPEEEAPDMRRLLENLSSRVAEGRGLLKESGEVADGFIVLLNGRSIEFSGGMEAELTEGDEVAIFPPLSGG